MSKPFSDLIGRVIHNCGAIEFIINQLVVSLATDTILATEALRSPLHNRIELLGRMLRARRKGLGADWVDDLVKRLKNLANDRNVLAHNPIVQKDGCTEWHVICLRTKNEHQDVLEYYEADVKRILADSLVVLGLLTQLLPQRDA